MADTSQFQAKPPGYSWLMSKWTLRPKSSGIQGHKWFLGGKNKANYSGCSQDHC